MRIVYNSYAGRYSDSPRALYHALLTTGDHHEHIWLADPRHVASFPRSVETVEIGSADCVDALESADLLIANTHTEVDWSKPSGAVYLQTWHGTPLKRIHWDVLWAPEGRLERLQRDVDRWDLLLSPNAYSTPYLRQAFRYEGEVLETGYPRNDVLLSAERSAVRARVRESLGISEGTRVVLYAPTWRDDAVFGRGAQPPQLALDVDAFADALGADHCLLLRLHFLITGQLAAIDHASVRDVSAYPEVSDLYLAADLLVTDYSSAMFDFAVTGKPLLFFAYDLASYRDSLRGFYFDLEPIAPGPLVQTTAELIAAIRDVDRVAETYRDRYARFRARFGHLEDGHATRRTLDRVLVGGPRARA